jgi:hypothetical protein
MRGARTPSVTLTTTESQNRFRSLSRGRRVKLAHAAKTTLVKADQWARGESKSAEIATALEQALASLKKK